MIATYPILPSPFTPLTSFTAYACGTEQIERKCACCDGAGVAPDATGSLRPCSRCRPDDFNEWAKRPLPHGGRNG